MFAGKHKNWKKPTRMGNNFFMRLLLQQKISRQPKPMSVYKFGANSQTSSCYWGGMLQISVWWSDWAVTQRLHANARMRGKREVNECLLIGSTLDYPEADGHDCQQTLPN